MVIKQSFKTLIVAIFVLSLSLCSIPAASTYDMPNMPDMSYMPNIPYMPHMYYMPNMSKMSAIPRMNMPGMPRTGSGTVKTQSTTAETRDDTGFSNEFETSGKSKTEGYDECWSHLSKIDNCVNNILSAYSFRKFDEIGSVCCLAINTMTKDCHAKTLGSFHDHFFVISVSKQCSGI